MLSNNHSKSKKLVSVVLICLLLAGLIMVNMPLSTVGAATGSAEVWWSSEKNPKDMSWYTSPKPISYTLSKQSDITLINPDGASVTAINVDPTIQYQDILGIGSSMEESTVYNLSRMSSAKRTEVLTQLVDPVNGIGMNLMRICIGTPDFTSRTFYSYDDMPSGQTDPNLTNFSIQKDIDYNIVSTIKQALAINPNLKIFASPWSPPGWMKTSGSLIRGQLKSDYISILAKYYRMAMQAYAAQGIPIYAMTLQNEPLLEIDYPSCSITSEQEKLLSVALKDEFTANGLNTKILVFDHNFSDAQSYVTPILGDASGYAAVDGVAFHDYSGDPSAMTTIHNLYPAKDMQMTERMLWGCAGADRIAQFFRNWSKSYNAWVTMLDSNIQPEQWTGTPDPPIMVQSASNYDTYWNTPEVYLFGQFSKFVQRGARRIDSNYGSTSTVTDVSFLNPDNTVVTVVINQSTSTQNFKIMSEGKQITASLPAGTVGTYRWTRSGAALSTPTPLPTPTPLYSKVIPGKVEAESYSAMSGISLETCTDTGGGVDTAWLDTGDWMDYNVNVQTAGTYTVQYRVASPNTTGQIQLKSGSTVLNTVTVPSTGGWQTWTTVTGTAALSAGSQTLRVYVGNSGFNLNWINFTNGATPTPTPTGGPTATPTPTPTPGSTPAPIIFNNFDTNQGYSAGPNSTAAYNSSGANVILTVNVSGDPGNANQCVKVVPQSGTSVNGSTLPNFSFWIDDTQGNNTIKITMVDTSNAVWSGWTSMSSVKNTWMAITLPMSSVTGINKAAIKEIRIGEWNSGTYYVDGLQFNN